MKDRIVGGVDLVAAVAVADDEEVVEAAGHQLALGPDSMEKIICHFSGYNFSQNYT